MEILEHFVVDHERLRSLLVLFESELTAYENGAEADLQLMQDVVSSYTAFFNHAHHPLEECLFERMAARAADANDKLGRALPAHQALMQTTERMCTTLDEVLQGCIRPRDELLANGRRFLRQHREHMRREEQESFKLAERYMSMQDWHAMQRCAVELPDRARLDCGRRQVDAWIDSLRTGVSVRAPL